MKYEFMKYELLDNGVAKISIDNGKANSINQKLAEDLMSALDRAENEAKAVLICGKPGMFSAGYDIKALENGMEAARDMLSQGIILLKKMYRFPLPLIAACEGHAVGLGLFILLVSDYRVGALGKFTLRLPETAIGMPFTKTLTIIAKTHIDARHHSRAIIQSVGYDPESAANIGILDEIVDADSVIERALEKTLELIELPADQYKINKLDIRAAEIEAIEKSPDF